MEDKISNENVALSNAVNECVRLPHMSKFMNVDFRKGDFSFSAEQAFMIVFSELFRLKASIILFREGESTKDQLISSCLKWGDDPNMPKGN